MRNILRALLAVCLVAVATHAVAETDAQWKPSKFNKISTCRSLWIGLGDVPGDSNAVTRDTTFVCHTRFVLSYDSVTKTPDWVIERIPKAQVSGDNDRPSQSFVVEKRVPPRGRATNQDYTRTPDNFARGHQAPSEDFNKSSAWMKESFVYSNAVPQVGAKFNSSIWGTLEDEVRKAAKGRDEIYVITGPVRGDAAIRSRTITEAANACGKAITIDGPQHALVCAANNRNHNVPCKTGVGVPIALYKIIYDPKTGDAYAFVLPNRDHDSQTGDQARPYLEKFRVTVAVIEAATGLHFFPAMTAAKQDQAVNKCAPGTLW